MRGKNGEGGRERGRGRAKEVGGYASFVSHFVRHWEGQSPESGKGQLWVMPT